MQYRKFGRYDIEVSSIGFGCMRLPILNGDSGQIDEDEAIKLIRYGIDNGINYIDTAYIYHNGQSEVFLGKALKEGYREKVYLADKSPVWLVKEHEDFNKFLNQQLNRLETDHIDFYLMHALNKNTWDNIKNLRVFDFIEEAKKDGRIRYAGFSFHDKLEVFKEISDAYDWDFCQIQYNYMDEYNQAGVEGLRYAAAKNMAVVIMEPLLGGKLAKTPPKEVQELWDRADVKRSPAEWGLTWLWNQPEVTVVLSGMNSMDQITENIKTASNALVGSMQQEETEIVNKVKDKYRELTKVSCTACKYCLPCPVGVEIPRIFGLYNQASMYNDFENCSSSYMSMEEKSKANSCIKCGKCEKVCPQHLEIRRHLEEAHLALTK